MGWGVNDIKYVKLQVPCLEQKYMFIHWHHRYLLGLFYKLESGIGTESAAMEQTYSLTWQCLLIRNGNCSFEEKWCFLWRPPNISREENLIFLHFEDQAVIWEGWNLSWLNECVMGNYKGAQ